MIKFVKSRNDLIDEYLQALADYTSSIRTRLWADGIKLDETSSRPSDDLETSQEKMRRDLEQYVIF